VATSINIKAASCRVLNNPNIFMLLALVPPPVVHDVQDIR
jgi:hypothetical protein